MLTRSKQALVLLACLAPVACAFYMICTHWVPTPFWDEWDTPAAQLASYYRGTLSLAELVSQHNEHRILFPRLIYLPLAILAGLDLRYEMVLTLCWVCLGAVGLFKLLAYSSRSRSGRALIFCMMTLVLFSPRQYENFLQGVEGVAFVPTIALIFALLVNVSGRSLRAKTILNATLALVGTYSFGNGMLVWPFAFPLERGTDLRTESARSRILWRAIYGIMAAASVGSYFISYRHPPLSPALVSPIARLPDVAHFVLVWVGSLFSAGVPALNGALLLLLFLGLVAAAIRLMWRTGDWRSHYPWVAMGCFTLVSGVATAITRLGFPALMAGDVRYAAFTVFFYIATLGLGFSVYQEMDKQGLAGRSARLAAVLSLGLIVAMWTITFKKERALLRLSTQERKHLLLVTRWSEAIPDNPEIGLLSPYAEMRQTIRTLDEHDALRPRLVRPALANIIKQAPSRSGVSAGTLERVQLYAGDHLLLKGWAQVPGENRRADCVVIGYETADGRWKPFCVIETGAEARGNENESPKRAGFSRLVATTGIPSGAVAFRSWAIDLTSEHAFAMSGSHTLIR